MTKQKSLNEHYNLKGLNEYHNLMKNISNEHIFTESESTDSSSSQLNDIYNKEFFTKRLEEFRIIMRYSQSRLIDFLLEIEELDRTDSALKSYISGRRDAPVAIKEMIYTKMEKAVDKYKYGYNYFVGENDYNGLEINDLKKCYIDHDEIQQNEAEYEDSCCTEKFIEIIKNKPKKFIMAMNKFLAYYLMVQKDEIDFINMFSDLNENGRKLVNDLIGFLEPNLDFNIVEDKKLKSYFDIINFLTNDQNISISESDLIKVTKKNTWGYFKFNDLDCMQDSIDSWVEWDVQFWENIVEIKFLFSKETNKMMLLNISKFLYQNPNYRNFSMDFDEQKST